MLLLAGFGLTLLLFLFELAEIHDLADWRLGVGRDFHQIEPGFLGHLHRACGGDDADIFPICADQANLGRPDAIVDARAGFALRRGIVRSAGYGGGPLNGYWLAQDSLVAGKLQPEKPQDLCMVWLLARCWLVQVFSFAADSVIAGLTDVYSVLGE